MEPETEIIDKLFKKLNSAHERRLILKSILKTLENWKDLQIEIDENLKSIKEACFMEKNTENIYSSLRKRLICLQIKSIDTPFYDNITQSIKEIDDIYLF